MRKEIALSAVPVMPPTVVIYWHKFIEVLPDFIMVTTFLYGILSVALVIKKLKAK